MQILVLYYSKGGNTRKLAEAVVRGIETVPGAKALLRTTREVTKDDFQNSDGNRCRFSSLLRSYGGRFEASFR